MDTKARRLKKKRNGVALVELLPCPYCNEPPVLEESGYRQEGEKNYRVSWKIRCKNTYVCLAHPDVRATDKQIAIKGWNTRGGVDGSNEEDEVAGVGGSPDDNTRAAGEVGNIASAIVSD